MSLIAAEVWRIPFTFALGSVPQQSRTRVREFCSTTDYKVATAERGLDKEVGLWQDERAQTQVFVIQAPSGWHRGPPITAEEIANTAPLPPPSERELCEYE